MASTRARLVYKALTKIGWYPVHQKGSHIKLRHSLHDHAYEWAFHDSEEIGPHMLARIAALNRQTSDRVSVFP